MQNRNVNTPDNVSIYKDRSMVGGLSSIAGTFSGITGGRFLPFNSSPIVTALSTAAVVGAYLASAPSIHTRKDKTPEQRVNRIKETVVKSEIGAASAGVTSLAGWAAIRFFDTRNLLNLSRTPLTRSCGKAVGVAGIVGTALPLIPLAVSKLQSVFKK